MKWDLKSATGQELLGYVYGAKAAKRAVRRVLDQCDEILKAEIEEALDEVIKDARRAGK